MNEDTFNMTIRKFLKTVGVTSQRVIEDAVRKAIADGRLEGNETLSTKIVLTLDKIELRHEIDGKIELG